VLLSLPIRAENPNKDVLIDLEDIFMTDFANMSFGLGTLDRSRSTWHKIKTFANNIEIQVSATFSGGAWGYMFGNDSVIDPRGNTLVIHYGLVQLPSSGYTPRLADDRVGYFLSATRDFSTDSKDTSFVRYVNRWRLERADTDAKNKDKLSVPKKKIVFWVEKSVPYEYRPYVREGILEWNKAFEKIGFRDAIEVRQQEEEDFDPEDINYNTFRWITTGGGFAMGPSRANPLTGEILDADIIFDADMVRFWKQEAKMMGASRQALAIAASPIRALRKGWTLPPIPVPKHGQSWIDRSKTAALPGQPTDPQARLWAIQQGVCQCGTCMRQQLGLAALAVAAAENGSGDGVPEELIGQAIKYVVMHEVGHTLGLRHNFKASSMLKNGEINNPAITRKKGMAGSVMDYLPVNLAPKGTKQGDYFTTTIGPYDYWAIEYAYRPLDGDTEGEVAKLQEIATRGAKPGHDYGTDEDLFGTSDPLINAFDLGADPMQFATERMQLTEELMKTLADRVVEKGEGYQRARYAFSILLNQYGDAAYLAAAFVGAEHAHRDHRGDPSGRDPLVPVPAEKQRQALQFLQQHILTDKHFQFPPELLRKLAAERWYHWGSESSIYGSVDYPLHESILTIQSIVLDQLLDPAVLNRVQNNALKTNKEQCLTVAEIFRSLTDGIWSEFPVNGEKGKEEVKSSIIRRNLQREHLKNLFQLVLGQQPRQDMFFLFFGSTAAVPPDARSLARMHLREIQQRINRALGERAAGVDDTARAHLEECRDRIERALSASMQVQEP
jgi:hypothetical protein